MVVSKNIPNSVQMAEDSIDGEMVELEFCSWKWKVNDG